MDLLVSIDGTFLDTHRCVSILGSLCGVSSFNAQSRARTGAFTCVEFGAAQALKPKYSGEPKTAITQPCIVYLPNSYLACNRRRWGGSRIGMC